MTFINESLNILSKEFEKKHKIDLLADKYKSVVAFFIYAMSRAIKDSPVINAVIDPDVKNTTYRDYVDMIVPISSSNPDFPPVNVVLRDCEKKSFTEILKEIISFEKQVNEGKVNIEDMTGGTISINPNADSLLGVGSLEENTTVKLGINKISRKAHCVNNNPKDIQPRDIMLISLTYDHRLIDGKEGVMYLRRVKELLENPLRMIMDL